VLPPAVLHALRYIVLSDLEKICDFVLLSPSLERLSDLAENYLLLHTEKKHRNEALEYYKKL
jgi:hypothetical protein